MSGFSVTPVSSLLQQASAALQRGDSDNALALYQQAASQKPYLANSVAFLVAYLASEKAGLPLAKHWQTAPKLIDDSALVLALDSMDQNSADQNNTDQSSADQSSAELAQAAGLDKTALAIAINAEQTASGTWQALNADPYFIANLANKMLEPGFYLLQLNVAVEQPLLALHTKLYIDYGMGFNEKDILLFSVKPNQDCSRFVFFKQHVKNLRFDPLDQMLAFSINTFELQHVPTVVAIKEIEQICAELHVALPALSEHYQTALYHCYDEQVRKSANKISYEEWIQRKEAATYYAAELVAKKVATWLVKSRLSVIIAVDSGDTFFLRRSITSVLAQSYTNYELLVVFDEALAPADLAVLTELAAADNRLKAIKHSGDAQLTSLINNALSHATGDFVTLVQPGDELARQALYFIAEAINTYPHGQVFYSDEDKIDADGVRANPFFKTAWNPDLFFSQNYVANLSFYKTSLVKMVGGYKVNVAGVQGQDLLLRCLPYINPNEIQHVAYVLYHARVTPVLGEGINSANSTNSTNSTNTAAIAASISALTRYFAENGPPGVTVQTGLVANTYKVNWPIPDNAPKVSLLIPTRDRKALTEVAVRSILAKTTYANYEIVIVDNGSVEAETLAFFKQIQQEDKRVSVISYDHPFNYSAINNFGVKHTTGELVGLINNDIEVINGDWLTEMVSHAIRPDIGCVGAKLHYPNGRIQHAGVVLGIGGVASHGFKLFPEHADGYANRLKVVQNYCAVTAACLLVKRDLYTAVGGLNEDKLTVGYNDVDFCLKIYSKGLRNVWTPYAKLIHHESISRGDDLTAEKQHRLKNEREYMLANWGGLLDNDPYYSPHLTKDADDFSLRLHSSTPLCFDNNIIYEWNARVRARKHRYACVFAGFDANSVLHDYVIYYLQALANYFDIYFVTTAEQMHESGKQLQLLQGLCKSVVVRKNEGYDFGSWAYGVNHYRTELAQYDGVLLSNDSVYGPIYDLAEFIAQFEQGEADVLGMTDSNELDFHLQSYFVMYKALVFNSAVFKGMWQNISVHTDKWDIIKKYEIGFSQRLMRVGNFKLQAYCDMTGYPNLNHTHVHWQDLITKKGFPFVKIELVKKNPFNINILQLDSVIKSCSDYDVSLIKSH